MPLQQPVIPFFKPTAHPVLMPRLLLLSRMQLLLLVLSLLLKSLLHSLPLLPSLLLQRLSLLPLLMLRSLHSIHAFLLLMLQLPRPLLLLLLVVYYLLLLNLLLLPRPPHFPLPVLHSPQTPVPRLQRLARPHCPQRLASSSPARQQLTQQPLRSRQLPGRQLPTSCRAGSC